MDTKILERSEILDLPRDAIFDSEVKDGDRKGIARRLLIDNTILAAQETVSRCGSHLPGCGENTEVDPRYRGSGKAEPTEVQLFQLPAHTRRYRMIYRHLFYLAKLSAGLPRKLWPTGY